MPESVLGYLRHVCLCDFVPVLVWRPNMLRSWKRFKQQLCLSRQTRSISQNQRQLVYVYVKYLCSAAGCISCCTLAIYFLQQVLEVGVTQQGKTSPPADSAFLSQCLHPVLPCCTPFSVAALPLSHWP